MSVRIEKYDRYVVYRNGQYLMGAGEGNNVRWSTSPWDAWWKKERDIVRRVAWEFGAHVRQFNPVSGEVR